MVLTEGNGRTYWWIIDEMEKRGYEALDEFEAAEPAEFARLSEQYGTEPEGDLGDGLVGEVPSGREAPEVGAGSGQDAAPAGQRNEPVGKISDHVAKAVAQNEQARIIGGLNADVL